MDPGNRCRTFRSIPWADASINRRPVDPHEGTVIVGGSVGLPSPDAHRSREPLVGLSMKTFLPIAVAVLLFQTALAPAATVLYCPFDPLEGWSVRAGGATTTKIVDKPDRTRWVTVSTTTYP